MCRFRSSRRVARGRIRTLAEELLEASTLCAIATVAPRGRAYVNTAYFAWSPRLDLVWLSEPGATHSGNVRARAGLEAHVDVLVAFEDTAEHKPHPDPNRRALASLNATAGLEAVGVSCGYGTADALLAAGAACVCDTIADLAQEIVRRSLRTSD